MKCRLALLSSPARLAGGIDADRPQEGEIVTVDAEKSFTLAPTVGGQLESLRHLVLLLPIDHEIYRPPLFTDPIHRAADIRGIRQCLGQGTVKIS